MICSEDNEETCKAIKIMDGGHTMPQLCEHAWLCIFYSFRFHLYFKCISVYFKNSLPKFRIGKQHHCVVFATNDFCRGIFDIKSSLIETWYIDTRKDKFWLYRFFRIPTMWIWSYLFPNSNENNSQQFKSWELILAVWQLAFGHNYKKKLDLFVGNRFKSFCHFT